MAKKNLRAQKPEGHDKKGRKLPAASLGIENRTAPIVSSKVSAPGGVGAGYGFDSGHNGVRKGAHPHAPRNG